MMLLGEFIVKGHAPQKLKYTVLNSIEDYDKSHCILVKNLDLELTSLMNDVHLIITESGTKHSHMAIVAGEYKKPVLLIPGITEKIDPKGELHFDVDMASIKIQ